MAIKKWIESKKTCPICRVNWNNFQIYINGENDTQLLTDANIAILTNDAPTE